MCLCNNMWLLLSACKGLVAAHVQVWILWLSRPLLENTSDILPEVASS